MHIDFILAGALGLLLILGTTILWAVAPQVFPLQFFYIILAVILFFSLSRLDSVYLETLTPIFYVSILILLILTEIIGVFSHGAVRWLPLGPATLQPSEFAKPIVALATAWMLTHYGKSLVISFLLLLLPAILVFLQPDLTTSAILGVAWLGVLINSQISLKGLVRLFLPIVLLIFLVFLTLAPYQKERLTSFLQPNRDPAGTSYQSKQAMIAVGSGGLFGRGLGQGSQTQLAFLPARQTDFIFASIGEELGFIGMFLVLASFFVIFWRILAAMFQAKSTFSRMAVGGIFLYLFVQVFVNIAMNLGMFPVAGVPLPLVSAGGSALISTMMALGLVMALRK
ncbi:rod shape-determining protein RodA [Candidatus Microgenomates bacterium]|nr:rod shape-determining protein RodA [Candidatus Microgenomates bacterium]